MNEDIPQRHLKLARCDDGPEIFYSLQGEGRHVGRPSVFVRTSRCNLSCVYCDTPYTWNWRGTSFAHQDSTRYEREAETIRLRTADVAARVRDFPCKNVVFTGGEPLLQARTCAEVAAELRVWDAAYGFDVETNGTVAPQPELDRFIDLYTVSPKLHASGVPERLRSRPHVSRLWAQHPRALFKFAISSSDEVQEVLAFCADYGVSVDRVYLMPESRSAAELEARQGAVAALCSAWGFRYSDRLHLRLYGGGRGV